eukprot:6409238-Prymnesium_polylepis.1
MERNGIPFQYRAVFTHVCLNNSTLVRFIYAPSRSDTPQALQRGVLCTSIRIILPRAYILGNFPILGGGESSGLVVADELARAC